MTKNVRRLFTNFQPEHYSVVIDPDRDTMRVSGVVTVRGMRRGRPSQRLTFHQNGLKISQPKVVLIDRKKGRQDIEVTRINHHKSLNEVRLHTGQLLYPGEYEITMHFEGIITNNMHGIYPCYYDLSGKRQALIATQFESHHAREAFPCIDEPEAKATFDLTLISPAGETAISNMPAKTQKEKNGKLHTVFETSPRMSTYLLAFVYGDMQHKAAVTKDGVEVRVWSTRAHDPVSLEFATDVGVRAIERFNDYFSVPYPLQKCDHVALPDFSNGAMENWGLITYREICLLAHPKTTPQATREYVAMVICHELSHQWFGNLVTMKWWDDLWLNESFADVMEYLMSDMLIPEWHFWNSFVVNEGLSALRRDATAGVQAVKCEVHHPDEISTLFDPSIVYAKGGRLLNMLRRYLGDDTFRAGLKEYFTTHAYKNTVGADLWEALSHASKRDVAGFLNPWLTRPGFPVITLDQNGRELTISQAHFLMDPGKADPERVWPVPLLSSAGGVPALLEGKETKVALPSDDFVRINDGAVGHFIVRYARPEHAAALAKMAKTHELEVPERLMLLHDSSMLARAGYQPFSATMQLLEQYDTEESEPVWDLLALVIADARRFIDSMPELEPAIKNLLRKLIAALYEKLGWEETAGEPVEHTKLRATIIGLGVYAEHPAILQTALELFEKYKTDEHAIPAELRSIVFGAAVRRHVPGAFQYLLKLEESTQNVDLKQDIMTALTLAHKPEEVETLLGRLKDPAKVRPQDLDRQLIYLMRNRHARSAAWKWLRDNWAWITKTFSGDNSYDSFPRYAASCFNTHELLDEYTAFFGPMKDQPALARNITMGIEELQNRIAWIERDAEGMRTFFAAYAESGRR